MRHIKPNNFYIMWFVNNLAANSSSNLCLKPRINTSHNSTWLQFNIDYTLLFNSNIDFKCRSLAWLFVAERKWAHFVLNSRIDDESANRNHNSILIRWFCCRWHYLSIERRGGWRRSYGKISSAFCRRISIVCILSPWGLEIIQSLFQVEFLGRHFGKSANYQETWHLDEFGARSPFHNIVKFSFGRWINQGFCQCEHRSCLRLLCWVIVAHRFCSLNYIHSFRC